DPAARPASARAAGERAARLHQALTGNRTAELPARAEIPPLTRADAQPVTLVAPAGSGPAARWRRWWPGRMWSWRQAGLAIAAVALAAGLTGALLGSLLASPQPSPATRASRPASSPAAATVRVAAGRLIGQPADAVARRLRQLGLRPRITRAPTGQYPPGTVISVQPSGPLPRGSVVVITAAAPPPAHRHPPGHRPPPGHRAPPGPGGGDHGHGGGDHGHGGG
ncbi:MAG: PASTA domain-containing protein, partial [Actinobacteria bacterium]|nr:PASTA domain-containing protein [Actinomycetota bacterium]